MSAKNDRKDLNNSPFAIVAFLTTTTIPFLI